MKANIPNLFLALALLAFSIINAQLSNILAQGTTFTYQGCLMDGGSPANGNNYGMVFYLYDAPTNGNLLGNEGIVSVTVSNGLFTVPLDFGNVFDGNARWLEITVQKNGGSFTTLAPRQQLTPVPYAIFANTASNLSGTVTLASLPNGIGGGDNSISNATAVVVGGYDNQARAAFSSILGGFFNTTFGQYSTVTGGEYNFARADYSFAAGQNANAQYKGSFVWADDSTTSQFGDTAANQFCVRAAGGVRMNVSGSSGVNPAALYVNSTSGNGVGFYVTEISSDAAMVINNTGTGDLIKAFNSNGNTPAFEVVNNGTVYANGIALTSDRNAKQNFTALDSKQVLAKVVALPLTEWNYKVDSADQKHIGPMAQDFHAAFQLDGADDKHISVVDEGGVALAAIQGLNEKLNDKDAEIQTLKQQNDLLAKRLNELEATVKSMVK